MYAFPRLTTGTLRIEIDDRWGKLNRVVTHLTGVEEVPELEPQPDFRRDKMG